MAESAPLERIFYVNYWYEFNDRHWPQDFVTYTDKILQLFKNKYHQKLVLFNLNNECYEEAFNLGHNLCRRVYEGWTLGNDSQEELIICFSLLEGNLLASFNILVGIKRLFIRFLHRVKTILIIIFFNLLQRKYDRDCGSHHYWRPTTIIWRCR